MLENRFRNGMNWNLIVWWTRGGGVHLCRHVWTNRSKSFIVCVLHTIIFLAVRSSLQAVFSAVVSLRITLTFGHCFVRVKVKTL